MARLKAIKGRNDLARKYYDRLKQVPGQELTRHLTYRELLTAATAPTELIEDFQNLFGNWVVDADMRL